MTLQDLILAGWGLLSTGREEIEKTVEKAVEEGKKSKEEGQNLIEELSERAKEEREGIVGAIDKEINSFLNKLGLASGRDIGNLEKRIEKLEAKLSKKSARKR